NLVFDLLAAFVLLRAGEAVGIDDERAVFALAHLAAELERLAVGHPDRTGEAFEHGVAPEHQHIDALVGLAIGAQRTGDAPGGMLGVPRLEPGTDPLLEVGDDLGGDAGVDVSAYGRGRHVQPSVAVRATTDAAAG